jgi:site-specific DNA-methyltransferase (adenine-specific)
MAVRKPHYPLDRRNKADGLKLLKTTPSEYTRLVFFDPQYRQLLDHLKYGDEGKRQTARVALPQMSGETIRRFGHEIVRVLKPSGYVAMWIDKYILTEGLAPSYFDTDELVPTLKMVDLITWNKGKIGMGYRSRRKGEYLLIFQKYPIKARATWHTMPCIPDVWDEKIEGRIHVHQKPIGLQRAIIEATTRKGEVVMSPTAGSFSVMEAAHACGRRFLGGDILGAPKTKKERDG